MHDELQISFKLLARLADCKKGRGPDESDSPTLCVCVSFQWKIRPNARPLLGSLPCVCVCVLVLGVGYQKKATHDLLKVTQKRFRPSRKCRAKEGNYLQLGLFRRVSCLNLVRENALGA